MDFLFFVVFFILGASLAAIWFLKKNQRLQQEFILLDSHFKKEEALAKKLASEKELIKEECDALQRSVIHAESERVFLKEKFSSQQKELVQMQEKMTLKFESMAQKILDDKSQKFVKQNQDQMEGVLKPFHLQLRDFKDQVAKSYDLEARARASLQGELKQLFQLNQHMAKEAKNLTSALQGSNKTQGNWGEMILERILEQSGLRKGTEFTVQDYHQDEDGKRFYPDVKIHLPEGRHLIIDSKVSLTAYEHYYSQEDVGLKQQSLKAHVASIKQHIKALHEKAYHRLKDVNSPDFVFMFMPIEPALPLAMQEDPALFSEALDKQVMMVTPSSLVATLRVISSIWKQDRQNKNALKIADEAGKMYDKFESFVKDLEAIGRQINQTSQSYESAMKKLKVGKGNLLKRSEDLKQLGAKASKQVSIKSQEEAAFVPEKQETNLLFS